MSLTVGDKFQSFALWEEAVKKYELENYVQRRDARTIQAAKKRLTSTTDRQFNEDLQYYELKYCYTYQGGKEVYYKNNWKPSQHINFSKQNKLNNI